MLERRKIKNPASSPASNYWERINRDSYMEKIMQFNG